MRSGKKKSVLLMGATLTLAPILIGLYATTAPVAAAPEAAAQPYKPAWQRVPRVPASFIVWAPDRTGACSVMLHMQAAITAVLVTAPEFAGDPTTPALVLQENAQIVIPQHIATDVDLYAVPPEALRPGQSRLAAITASINTSQGPKGAVQIADLDVTKVEYGNCAPAGRSVVQGNRYTQYVVKTNASYRDRVHVPLVFTFSLEAYPNRPNVSDLDRQSMDGLKRDLAQFAVRHAMTEALPPLPDRRPGRDQAPLNRIARDYRPLGVRERLLELERLRVDAMNRLTWFVATVPALSAVYLPTYQVDIEPAFLRTSLDHAAAAGQPR